MYNVTHVIVINKPEHFKSYFLLVTACTCKMFSKHSSYTLRPTYVFVLWIILEFDNTTYQSQESSLSCMKFVVCLKPQIVANYASPDFAAKG